MQPPGLQWGLRGGTYALRAYYGVGTLIDSLRTNKLNNKGLGFRVYRAQGSGFKACRVEGLGFRFRVYGLGFGGANGDP